MIYKSFTKDFTWQKFGPGSCLETTSSYDFNLEPAFSIT